jgi:hypothetical protein
VYIEATGLPPVLKETSNYFAGLVSGIVRSLELREVHEAAGVDLGKPLPDERAVDFVFDVSVAKRALEGDQPAFLDTLCELLQIAPDIDAAPFGAGF